MALTHDSADRVTRRVETAGGGAERTLDFGYDPRGRLTSVTGGGAPECYAWDVNGNRTEADGEAATYDAQDRLLRAAASTTTSTTTAS